MWCLLWSKWLVIFKGIWKLLDIFIFGNKLEVCVLEKCLPNYVYQNKILNFFHFYKIYKNQITEEI